MHCKSSFLPCSSRVKIFLPCNESSVCVGTLVCCYWSAMARSYWFISILIIILTTRCCSLIGPLCNRSVVMLFDHKHRCFRNFDFVVSIDVIRMNSYVDGFFNLTCVTLRIIINKVWPGPKQEPVLFQRRVQKLLNSENKQAVDLFHVL